jgi:WD40 repeat protein
MNRLLRPLAVLLLTVAAAPSASAQPFPPFDVVWQQQIDASFNDVVFSPDGQYVGAGANRFGSGRVYIWEADGTPTFETTFGADVNAVVFTPDGSALIAAHAGGFCIPNGGCGGFGNALSRWGSPGGGLQANIPFPQAYLSMEFTPDGQSFVGGNNYAQQPFNAVRFHDPVTLDSLDFVPALTAPDIAFSPDGSRLVTGGFENLQYDGAALVWDLATKTVVRELPHNALSVFQLEFPESVAYAPDGALIATGGFGSFQPTVKVWDAGTGALVYDFDVRTEPPADCGSFGLGSYVAFSPNGRYLAAATSCEPNNHTDLVVRFWEVATGELAAAYEMAGYFAVRGMSGFALSPTDNRLAFTFTSSKRSSDIVVARTELDLVGGSAAMTVSATPLDEPVVIGPGGGAFAFEVTLTNTSGAPQTVEVWSAVTGPAERDPVLGPVTVTLAAGRSATRIVTQQVPAQAPAGAYTYAVYVAPPGGAPMASDAFPFTKEAGRTDGPAGGVADDWAATGFEASVEATGPGGYALTGAGPNPFRTATALALTVAEGQAVRAEVFDALGRRVAVLHDGPVEAGVPVRLALDGAALAPGAYVVRVVGETFSTARLLNRAP